jgi:hypothetical protein
MLLSQGATATIRHESRSQSSRRGTFERKEKIQAVVTTPSITGPRKNISCSMVMRKKRTRLRRIKERRLSASVASA